MKTNGRAAQKIINHVKLKTQSNSGLTTICLLELENQTFCGLYLRDRTSFAQNSFSSAMIIWSFQILNQYISVLRNVFTLDKKSSYDHRIIVNTTISLNSVCTILLFSFPEFGYLFFNWHCSISVVLIFWFKTNCVFFILASNFIMITINL